MNKNKALVVVVLLAIMGIGGWLVTRETEVKSAEYIAFPVDYIEQVNFGLDSENIRFLENRITEYQAELDKEDLLPADRVSYLVAQAFDYRSLGDYASMDNKIAEAASLVSDSQPVLKTYSEMLFVQKKYQQSLDVAYQSIALDTSNYLPWLWRAELEEQLLVDPAGAWIIFDQALFETGNNIEILIAYAEFLERHDKTMEAKAIWTEAAIQYPDRKDVFLERINLIEE